MLLELYIIITKKEVENQLKEKGLCTITVQFSSTEISAQAPVLQKYKIFPFFKYVEQTVNNITTQMT